MGKKNKKKDFQKKRKICLNMIVKDEAHIIEETITSVVPYIDYWVICDTGSTDGTQKLIIDVFKKYGIPGDLHQHKWKDFGYNRTLALREAYNKAQYIWIMDADDLVKGNLKWPDTMTADAYNLIYGGDALKYVRKQVFKSTLIWRYECVLHEYAACVNKSNPTVEKLEGDYYIDSRRLGNRSKNKNKYLDDAHVLVAAHDNEKNNPKGNKQHMVRYSFYAGQSYFDFKDYENSIIWYQKRVDYGGWQEEVYYSMYRIGLALQHLQKPMQEIHDQFMKAHNFLPIRSEPLFNLAMEYRKQKDYINGYKYAKMGVNIPYPKDQMLFVTKCIYDWQMKNEVAINAFLLGNYQESLELSQQIVDDANNNVYNVPANILENIKNNMIHCQMRLNGVTVENNNNNLENSDGVTMNKEIYDLINKQRLANSKNYKIALLVPTTTKKTDKIIDNMKLLTTFLPSLTTSIDKMRRDQYVLYLGYDINDEVYDNKENMSIITEKIKQIIAGYPITVKCYRMDNSKKSVVHLWNKLYEIAYKDGCEYFYQLGDDILFESTPWAKLFINKLHDEFEDIGVVGPQDRIEVHRRLMTQSFVSRKHYEIFGYYYPEVFKNWFSDNWITDVYGLEKSYIFPNIGIKNCLAGGDNKQRYEIDFSARDILKEEVAKGQMKLLENL